MLCYIPLLWCHCLIIVTLCGAPLLLNWQLWLKGYTQNLWKVTIIIPFSISTILIFHYSKDITGRVSRNINRAFVPRVDNNFGKQSYYRGTVLWNCLSQTVTEATSLSSFKKLYYIHIWFMYVHILVCVYIASFLFFVVVLHVFIFLVCCFYPGFHWKSILIHWVDSLSKYYNQSINELLLNIFTCGTE